MIQLLTSNNLENLADNLSAKLQSTNLKGFTPDTVIVQSNGVTRWLRLQLADRGGICANLQCPFPKSFIVSILQNTIGLDTVDLLTPDTLTWMIFKELGTLKDQKEFKDIGHYLKNDSQGIKQIQLSERLAILFDGYQTFRPQTILEWSGITGKPLFPDPIIDQPGRLLWQRSIWEKLIGNRAEDIFPARLASFLQLDLAKYSSILPQSIHLFGLSFLPPLYMTFFDALSRVIDVHFYHLSPCREFWQDIVSRKQKSRLKMQSKEDGYWQEGNPLLSSMGAMGRDFSAIINNLQNISDEKEDFSEPSTQPRTLLHNIQQDILNLHNPTTSENNSDQLGPDDIDGDKSIQIHICHSPGREIEVLYDNILGLLNNDPTLHPRDILVMAPDIQQYAPYISAFFDDRENRQVIIPYSIADKTLTDDNPIATAFMTFLAGSTSRLTAYEVLSLLTTEHIYQHFGLCEQDIETIQRWIGESHICWGRDGKFRGDLDLPEFVQNSWEFGMKRMIMGYAMPSEAGVVDTILPIDIEGGDSVVLGIFFTFLESFFALSNTLRLSPSRSAGEWEIKFHSIMDSFFSKDKAFADDRQKVWQAISSLTRQAAAAVGDQPVHLQVMIQALSKQLTSEQPGKGFLHGGVTFCRLKPMRSIPARIIYLLGMNDGDFPRQERTSGFDLMASHPLAGDRNDRNDDRYIFLEALLSARDSLIISYTGRSIQDNSNRPPSVLVAELTDYINDSVPDSDKKAADQLLTHHLLQPFNPAYFTGESKLFSYSRTNLQGAKAVIARENINTSDALEAQTPKTVNQEESDTISLADLLLFFNHPTKYFMQKILGVYLERDDVFLPENYEPMQVPDQDFFLNTALIRDIIKLQGSTTSYEEYRQQTYNRLQANGILPLGIMGEKQTFDHLDTMREFSGRITEIIEDTAATTVDIDLPIGEDIIIQGSIKNFYPGVGCLVFGYSTNKGKYLIQAWIEGLVLLLAGQDIGQATIVCKDKNPTLLAIPQDATEATEILESLINIYRRGCTHPLPLFPKTSFSWAIEEDFADARKNWLPASFGNHKNEGEDSYNSKVFSLDFFDANNQDTAPMTSFMELAQTVYGPIQAAAQR